MTGQQEMARKDETMGILEQIKTWTPERGDSARSDFSDDKAYVHVSRAPKEMVRIVKGATDLRDAMPSRPASAFSAAVSAAPTVADDFGQPSPAQRELIVKLVKDLMELDSEAGEKAATYTRNMTDAKAWTRGRGGNASQWIERLLDKLRSVRANTPPIKSVKPAFDTYSDVTDGNYAFVRDGKTHFYRITRKEGKGRYAGRTFLNVQERASEMLFNVDAWPARKFILDGIRSAGVAESHRLYADRLGQCWHCDRALTDDTGNPYRPYGLGPTCGAKMMG